VFGGAIKSVYSDSLPWRVAKVIFSVMKRWLIALIVMLALGLQGSLVAFASAAPQSTDCQTPAESPDIAHKSCCPSGLHTASCCLNVCLSAVAVTVSPAPLVWYGRTVRPLLFRTATFSSRGETPLTRPPIL
jgi:hypothetical protein